MKKAIYVLFVMLTLMFTLYGQAPLQVGDQVPDFTGTSDDGSSWNVKEHLGKHYLVIYFYPAAMTGGCTAQACNYRDHQGEIEETGAHVVGISGDTPEGLKLFREAHNLNFTLLSDETGEIAGKFGVPTREGGSISRELGGKLFDLYRGITASRWTFVIGPDGTILYKNEAVNAGEDTGQVLAFIKEHKVSG